MVAKFPKELEELVGATHPPIEKIHKATNRFVPELVSDFIRAEGYKGEMGRRAFPEQTEVTDWFRRHPALSRFLVRHKVPILRFIEYSKKHPIKATIIYCTFTPIPNPPRAIVFCFVIPAIVSTCNFESFMKDNPPAAPVVEQSLADH